MTNEPASEQLIVCAGDRVSWICATVMRRIQWPCRVIMQDWADDETLALSSVVWVVDDRIDKKTVMRGMRMGVPLLAPEANSQLRRMCVKGQCGLYYESCDVAEEALIYLRDHEAMRKAMGENARKVAGRLW